MDTRKTQNLINELGLENLPEEQKNSLIVNLAETLQNQITASVMEVLTQLEKEELDKLIEQGEDNKIEQYISSRVPNLENIAQSEYEKLKAEMLQTKEEMSKIIKTEDKG